MITDTRVEIGADRICTKVPKELNSDKNKTAIEKFVRIIIIIFEMTSWKLCYLAGRKIIDN